MIFLTALNVNLNYFNAISLQVNYASEKVSSQRISFLLVLKDYNKKNPLKDCIEADYLLMPSLPSRQRQQQLRDFLFKEAANVLHKE